MPKAPYNRVFDTSSGKKKRCPKCGIVKPLEAFALNRSRSGGHHSRCKTCTKEYNRQYWATHPQHGHKYKRLPLNIRRRRKLQSKYGMKPAEYEAMYLAQQGCCAICGKRGERYTELHVDHDHRSGKVRGLLCNGCNLGIGRFHDNADLLAAASAYMLKFGLANLAG